MDSRNSNAFLLRHGESPDVVAKLISGQRDVPMIPLGRAQARAAAGRVARCGPRSIVCSDLVRARETATIVANALGMSEPIVDPRLRERNWGIYHGQPRGSAPRLKETEAPSEGESLVSLRCRVLNALTDTLPRTLVVTHAGPILMAQQAAGWRVESPPPCGFFDFTHQCAGRRAENRAAPDCGSASLRRVLWPRDVCFSHRRPGDCWT